MVMETGEDEVDDKSGHEEDRRRKWKRQLNDITKMTKMTFMMRAMVRRT